MAARFLSKGWHALSLDFMLSQTRTYKSVVINGNVSKALRLLNNHAKEEGLVDKWRSSKIYLKPSHKRVLQQKETEKKLKRQEFKTMMYWVMQAKSRFACILAQYPVSTPYTQPDNCGSTGAFEVADGQQGCLTAAQRH